MPLLFSIPQKIGLTSSREQRLTNNFQYRILLPITVTIKHMSHGMIISVDFLNQSLKKSTGHHVPIKS